MTSDRGTNNYRERSRTITTSIGAIAVYIKEAPSDQPPVIFLHGVYFDHHMWDFQIARVHDRTCITLDMPLHGKSREEIRAEWTLNDCAEMLIDVLDELAIERVVAVGHSWGSMTIARAAYTHPDRFAAIGLCNMPFRAATPWQTMLFKLNHTMLGFRDFYTKQAAKALFGASSLRANPSLVRELKRPMDVLSKKQVQQVDTSVIVNADDATSFLVNLKVKAIALKGEEDYVPTPPENIRTFVVKGGHISPLEQPARVLELVSNLC